MDYLQLIPGTLRRRYKRFLADVVLDDGSLVVAHCPNTGSMRAVNVPGCRVWLSASDNPKRKLPWTWELIELPQEDGSTAMVSVHTGRANDIVEEALRYGHVPELAGYTGLRREVVHGAARLDFQLDGSDRAPCVVEVKQVTLREADGRGYFPDAVSARGRKHLDSLTSLVAQGRRAVLLFCVAHTQIEEVAPAVHLDPRYASSLKECVGNGVEVLAYGCRVTTHSGQPRAIHLADRLSVMMT